MGGLWRGRRLVICLMDGRHSVSEQCFLKAAPTSVSGHTAQTTSAAGAHPSGRFTTAPSWAPARACVCVYKCVTRAGKAHPSVCETINMIHYRASDCQTKVCDLWHWLSRLHVAACRHVCKGQFSALSGTPTHRHHYRHSLLPEGQSVRRLSAVSRSGEASVDRRYLVPGPRAQVAFVL